MGQLPTRQTVPASWVNRSLGLLATVALGYAPVAPADAQVGVRCADHGAYFRVVLDLPADGKLTVSRSPGTVRLGWPKEWTLAGAEKCLRSIQGLDGLERKGGKDLVLSYSPAGLKARTMSLADPPRWVVDVGRVGQTEEGRARSGESASKEPDGGGGSHPGGNYSGVPLPPAIPPEPPKELAEYRKRVARGGVNEVEKELGDKARGGKKLPASLGFLLGNLYQRQARDLDAAQALWHTARDHPGHPYSPEALRTAAAIYNRLGFHYEGAKPLEAFLRNYPRDPQRPLLQLRLGRLYALSNDPGAARQELVPLLYQGPEGLRPRARLWLAYLLDSAGEYAEAADKFRTARRQATKYFNSHPELMVAAGQADLMAGKANEAEGLLKEFTRRFHTHPRKVEAMVLRGQALARMGEWHQALGLYRQVLGGDAQADLKARARAGIVEALHALGNL
ncbi:MAG TPA: tetratricopeptide repeat protein, partial [Gammaproteobacteria bacterium]|nr:tetratricopeptide repeat protein [Gammaproteobacteria bacterium]